MTSLRLVPAVHRATHRIGLYLQGAGLGVSQGEAHVLAQLAAGPASVAELHAAFAHRRSTLTSILDRLEGRGLVRRELHPHDRRSFLVTPTASGRALARRVHSALAALEAAALRGLRGADVAGCEAVLAAVQQAAQRGAGRDR